MKRLVGLVVVILVVAAGVIWRPDKAFQTGAGVTAHNLCAETFIAGIDPDATFRELITALTGKFTPLIRYKVDRQARAVDAWLTPLFHAHAVFTPSYGCRLVYKEAAAPLEPLPAAATPVDDGFAPVTLVTTADPALSAAIDKVFAETSGQPPKAVKAVVIVKDGKVVAERYAPGFGVDTPLLSYSVAKSFTNALFGVLVGQGRLKADQPVGAPEWQAAGDPRGKLTLEDLMRMQSGLNAAETSTGFDPASWMLYTENDMAGFAAKHGLRRPPATEWRYTSANTLILDRVLGKTVGGGAAGLRRFADQQLLEPLHMRHVTMEFDGAGTFSGSAHVFAPARDYARFGLLYLNDGIAPDGSRILPEGWVAWSRRSTLGTDYGSGFWTNDGPSPDAAWRVAHGFPKDGFYASGHLGQKIYIIPSQHLVIARMGYTQRRNYAIEDDTALIATAITVLKRR